MSCFSTKPFSAGPVCVTVSILTSLFSCSDEAQIKTSIIAPEYSGPVVTWILPETWGENPAGGPDGRFFHAKTENGHKADRESAFQGNGLEPRDGQHVCP